MNGLVIPSNIPEALISNTDIVFIKCDNDVLVLFLQNGTCGRDLNSIHSIIDEIVSYNSKVVKELTWVPLSTSQRDLGILLSILSNSILCLLMWIRWTHVKRFQYNRLFVIQVVALNSLILRGILVGEFQDFVARIALDQVMKGISICIFSRFYLVLCFTNTR
jgi:hypothetical protein